MFRVFLFSVLFTFVAEPANFTKTGTAKPVGITNSIGSMQSTGPVGPTNGERRENSEQGLNESKTKAMYANAKARLEALWGKKWFKYGVVPTSIVAMACGLGHYFGVTGLIYSLLLLREEDAKEPNLVDEDVDQENEKEVADKFYGSTSNENEVKPDVGEDKDSSDESGQSKVDESVDQNSEDKKVEDVVDGGLTSKKDEVKILDVGEDKDSFGEDGQSKVASDDEKTLFPVEKAEEVEETQDLDDTVEEVVEIPKEEFVEILTLDEKGKEVEKIAETLPSEKEEEFSDLEEEIEEPSILNEKAEESLVSDDGVEEVTETSIPDEKDKEVEEVVETPPLDDGVEALILEDEDAPTLIDGEEEDQLILEKTKKEGPYTTIMNELKVKSPEEEEEAGHFGSPF